MKRQTSLSNHVIQFARFLRTKKFNVGPDEEHDALRGLTIVDWHRPDQFRDVMRAAFCKNFDQTLAFHRLYSQYWSELSKAVDSKTKEVEEEQPQPVRKAAPSIQSIKNWLNGNQQKSEVQDLHKASGDIITGATDLTSLANDYHREWQDVILLIQRYVEKKRVRRMIKSKKPIYVDFRGVLKSSMQKGGEITQFEFKERKVSKTSILLLCDVSKSMELYSRFIMQMMYALQNSSLHIQSYVFSTSLFSIGKQLKKQTLNDALDSVSRQVGEWGSGTQIGASLDTFLAKYGRKMGRNTFTFIVSDGWDAGDIDLLNQTLKRLRRHSEKLLWINPLAQSEHFDPQVLGMKAAMPYIDHLVPALDVGSLKRYLRNLK